MSNEKHRQNQARRDQRVLLIKTGAILAIIGTLFLVWVTR